ncbi:dihydrofolate reductase family protein [Nonomuraea solani]|uniref:dihydrofolate reductase family protein n=1 Tax=Nonomuraea solani TaxID=1144553 RepID=UPI0013585293|nr:dihydrofolate reductase family protein [Nonomuraea solani]
MSRAGAQASVVSLVAQAGSLARLAPAVVVAVAVGAGEGQRRQQAAAQTVRHARRHQLQIVFSSTLERGDGDNAPLATVVKRLRRQEGGDIVVLAGSSVIRQLLDAGEVDRLAGGSGTRARPGSGP